MSHFSAIAILIGLAIAPQNIAADSQFPELDENLIRVAQCSGFLWGVAMTNLERPYLQDVTAIETRASELDNYLADLRIQNEITNHAGLVYGMISEQNTGFVRELANALHSSEGFKKQQILDEIQVGIDDCTSQDSAFIS